MQTYNLEILTPALRELTEIALVHLELVGPVSARNITERIFESLERLKVFPLSGSIPHDKTLREWGYRYVVSGKYLCIYKLIGNTVFVYHIVHGATDYPCLFKNIQHTHE